MPQSKTQFGIMQGRLTPPEPGRFQAFPRQRWRDEIPLCKDAGIDYIEWIYDGYGADINPVANDEGIAELNALKAQYGVATPALCGDWFMDFPLIRCTPQQRAEREEVLRGMLHQARKIGAWRIVMPFVDASSMKTGEEKEIVLEVLRRVLPAAEETGVEIHLEADFDPPAFAAFLARIPHPMLKVNYDTGNSSGLGYRASEEFAAYGERIGSIHIKDRLRKPGGGIATMPLGQGSADFDDVFASIRKIGYTGGFTLQVARGADGDEVNWITQQLGFLRRHLD
jgi:L-ribulose-5-phosphate 3-epimerase